MFSKALNYFYSIRDLRSSNPLTIFSFFWALYCVFHFQYLVFYTVETAPEPIFLSWMTLGLAVIILIKPALKFVFLALVTIQLIEMWLLMPFSSNHSIIQFFFGVGIVISAALTILRTKNLESWFPDFAQVGRYCLLLMYFFGIFHKINADFINPTTSCAVALWQTYPFPEMISDGVWLHYAAIYGTFIIEGLVLLGLIFFKTRYYAICLGIGFHVFLGFSDFAYYPAFSMLSIALHMLFMPQDTLSKFKKSKIYFKLIKYIWPVSVIILTALLTHFAEQGNLNALIIIFGFTGISIFIFVILFGKDQSDNSKMLWPIKPVAGIIAGLFFLNCMMPYAGLKTQQTLNMFSNLHLENGRSNHLIFRNAPEPFEYLEGTVKVISLRYIDNPGRKVSVPLLELSYHDFLALMSERTDLVATYRRNGILYRNMITTDLQEEIDRIVLPKPVRKLFHFTGVDNTQPKPCQAIRK